MERKVVVTNLEQKESNLEKDQTEKEETPTTESILEPKEVDQNSEIESITSDALVVDNKGVSSEEISEPIIDEDLNSDGQEATTQVYEINEEILPTSKDDVDNKDGLNAPEFYSRIYLLLLLLFPSSSLCFPVNYTHYSSKLFLAAPFLDF